MHNNPIIHYINGHPIGLIFSECEGVYKPCFFDIAKAVELPFLENNSNFKYLIDLLLRGNCQSAIKLIAYESDIRCQEASLRIIRFNMIQFGCFLLYSNNIKLNRENLACVRSFVSGLDGCDYDESTILELLKFDFPGVDFKNKI
jgi:hypothetical protein